MDRDQFLAAERKAYEALFIAVLHAIIDENDYQAAFEARKQFLEQQRFQASHDFQSDQGFRAK